VAGGWVAGCCGATWDWQAATETNMKIKRLLNISTTFLQHERWRSRGASHRNIRTAPSFELPAARQWLPQRRLPLMPVRSWGTKVDHKRHRFLFSVCQRNQLSKELGGVARI